MATNQKRRQKKLAKKKAKRKETVKNQKKASIFSEAGLVAKARTSPIERCIMREDIIGKGIGTAVIARRMPDGSLGVGVYLLDTWCLGVKDAFFRVMSIGEFDELLERTEENETLEEIHPSCFRKIIEGCVEFSATLGFKPHRDFTLPRQLLMDIDSSVCPNRYTFGRNGRPCFSQGPNETPRQVRMIMDSLSKHCGEGNFDFITAAEGFDPWDE